MYSLQSRTLCGTKIIRCGAVHYVEQIIRCGVQHYVGQIIRCGVLYDLLVEVTGLHELHRNIACRQ